MYLYVYLSLVLSLVGTASLGLWSCESSTGRPFDTYKTIATTTTNTINNNNDNNNTTTTTTPSTTTTTTNNKDNNIDNNNNNDINNDLPADNGAGVAGVGADDLIIITIDTHIVCIHIYIYIYIYI